MAKTALQDFTKGLWDEVPPFRLVLGLCPTLAVTTTVENGIGMGLATTFVLVCANVLISLLKNAIPKRVRIACYIVVIATFVIVVELVMQAYTYELFQKLGIFIPLIVVNCIVLGRAEAFAAKNNVGRSLLDGLGIGIGFTLSLAVLSAVQELLGKNSLTFTSFFGGSEIPGVFGPDFMPFKFMVEAPGAFVCLGLLLCIMNMLGKKT